MSQNLLMLPSTGSSTHASTIQCATIPPASTSHGGPTITFYGTPKKIGWPVVIYPAVEIFGTPNKSLMNKVQYLFSGRKKGYAIFDK